MSHEHVIDRLRSGVQACRRSRHPRAPPYRDPLHVTSKNSPDATDSPTPDFETSLAELEAIVEKLEQGDLSLDDSLQHFERGVQLTRACQAALKQAEQKVEILLRRSGQPASDPATGYAPGPFEPDDDAG